MLDETLDLMGRDIMDDHFFQKHLLPHVFSRFLKIFPFDFFVKISLNHLELCLKSSKKIFGSSDFFRVDRNRFCKYTSKGTKYPTGTKYPMVLSTLKNFPFDLWSRANTFWNAHAKWRK